jgi:cation diffusion facilitator CzcD-associated flavoprotein CzcO
VDVPIVVIGAGQAGLSASYFLRRYGVEHVVLDGAVGPGGAWQHRWPSLRLGKVQGIHDLPDMRLGRPDASRPASEVVSEYFAAFEVANSLPIVRPVRVTSVRENGDGRLLVATDRGEWVARAVINATGTWERPFWPHYPGQSTFRGRQLHTAGYNGPEEMAGKRVVVVGGGASATQALAEISLVAAATTWVTRRPPVWREGPFKEQDGRAAVALVDERVRAGLPPVSVVGVTGLGITPDVAEARARGVMERLPMFDRVGPDGVTWDDGRHVQADVILWATGFRAALDHLSPLHLRAPGGGILMDGTRVVVDSRVHLVGYGPSASTVGATRAGRAAAREVRALLAKQAVSAA